MTSEKSAHRILPPSAERPCARQCTRAGSILILVCLLGAKTLLAERPSGMQAPSISEGASIELPKDVVTFKIRRDQCDYFRGEDPGKDPARARELNRNLERTCKGTDRQLTILRQHYAKNPKVKAALSKYEDKIE